MYVVYDRNKEIREVIRAGKVLWIAGKKRIGSRTVPETGDWSISLAVIPFPV